MVAMTPEDEALLAQVLFGGGLGQMQAPAPGVGALQPQPALLPPGQMMPARMPMPEQGVLYPPNMEGVTVKGVPQEAIGIWPPPPGATPAAPATPTQVEEGVGIWPPRSVSAPMREPVNPGRPTPPMDLGAVAGGQEAQTAVGTNDFAPLPPSPMGGVSPAQPAGAGPAMGGLFADKEEILARLGDMMSGWAMGAGGTWQDSLAAGGKMVAAGKLTRKEKKEIAASDNKTREWAISQGVDPATADAYVQAGQGKALIGLVEDYKKQAAQAGQRDPVVVGNKIVDKNTGEVIGDYGDAKAGPDQFEMVPADEVKRLGLDPSRPYQRNSRTGKIDPIGSSGQTIQVGSKLTETQSKDVSFLNRGMRAFENLNASFSDLASAADTYGGSVPLIGNYLKSDQYRKAEQAAREVLAVILRKDTGAAITDQEMEIYGKTFLPQPGDDKATIEQKRATAKNALDAMYTGLGSLGPEFVPNYQIGLPSAAAAAAAPAGSRVVIDGVTIEEIP